MLGVDDEIEQHLLKLAVIAANGAVENRESELWLHSQTVVQVEPGANGAGVVVPVKGCVVFDNRLVNSPGGDGTITFYQSTHQSTHVIDHNVEKEL